MNRLNKTLLQNASIHAVGGFRMTNGPRPARSYRNARRNLARALCASVPTMGWPTAWQAAQKATYGSMKPAPKTVDPEKVVRTVDVASPGGEASIGLAPRSEVEGAPEVEGADVQTRRVVVDEVDPYPVDETEPVKAKPGALSDDDLRAAVELRAKHPTTSAAAIAAGLSRNAFENRLKRAKERGITAEPASPPPPPKPPVDAPAAAPEKPKRNRPKKVEDAPSAPIPAPTPAKPQPVVLS